MPFSFLFYSLVLLEFIIQLPPSWASWLFSSSTDVYRLQLSSLYCVNIPDILISYKIFIEIPCLLFSLPFFSRVNNFKNVFTVTSPRFWERREKPMCLINHHKLWHCIGNKGHTLDFNKGEKISTCSRFGAVKMKGFKSMGFSFISKIWA